MSESTPIPMEHRMRFIFDNITDGVRDESILMFKAFDIRENQEVWILGRKVGEDKVMPVALLLDSMDAVKRYAPNTGKDNYDFSQVIQN
jgi:hypothetical protein